MFTLLINLPIGIASGLVNSSILNAIMNGIEPSTALSAASTGLQVLSWIVSLGLLLPTLGVAVRRLHDIGKTGWNIFINLIPIVGVIIYLVWLCKDSMPDENMYGENPKGM